MDLHAFGFREVGSWNLDRERARFALTALGDERVVYAFAVDGAVRYIGVCDNDKTTLRDRLRRYQSRAGAGANERIMGAIEEELLARRTVEILAWKPDRALEVGGLGVDLVKGLENPLIAALKPQWNIQGKAQ